MDKELLLYNYFANQLTDDEQLLFDELLKNDLDFKAQFEFEKDLKRVIKEYVNEDLKEKLVGYEREISGKDKSKPSKWRFKNWSIAASIALLIGLGWIGIKSFSGPDYNELYQDNFEGYPNTVYTISRADGDSTKERDAFAAYEAGDYEKAVAAFQELRSTGGISHVDFYQALSYLQLGKNTQAIDLLKNVMLNDEVFRAEANWYLALAYLKDSDKVNAVAALKRQVQDFEYSKEKAEALLRELD